MLKENIKSAKTFGRMGVGELSAAYDVSRKTFYSWLKPFQHLIGKRSGRYYNPRQIQIIFDKLGDPPNG
ncbi:hypothetical protein JMN32_01815 [Fulvivirga sp. 29W222]|uniref:Uncharacterized protein n=2 Tax=Fulvivirga marina TaxID=2494733 RepID=A0A937FVI3_9BACT|nr:hypothetical protein [Fulvivirga marina]